jgi:CheY-like chemotaxis protein
MTGLDLARRIREADSDCPILLWSGFERDDLRERARQMGIQHVLIKPVEIHSLASTIQKVLKAGSPPLPAVTERPEQVTGIQS